MVWSEADPDSPIHERHVMGAHDDVRNTHVPELDARFNNNYQEIESVAESLYPSPETTDTQFYMDAITVGQRIEDKVDAIDDYFNEYLDNISEDQRRDMYRYLGLRTLYNGKSDDGSDRFFDRFTN